MCLCSLVACWFPSIAYKISLLQDIGQFCIRNPGLFLNHADHLYTFSLLYICILETLPLLLFFLIMPCTLDCLIDTHVYISGWLDRFSRCKKIESYGRVFFFNRNINSRLRVGFENFWRCFNKTKEKKSRSQEMNILMHVALNNQYLWSKKCFEKQNLTKKMSVIFQSDKGLSAKRWPVFASFRGCVAAARTAGQIPTNNDSS